MVRTDMVMKQTSKRKAGYNSTYPKGGISFSKDSFEVNQNLVLRVNICAEKPAHHQSAKR